MIDFVAQAVNEGKGFFSISPEAAISGITESPLLLLKNPPGSTTRLLITHLVAAINSTSARTKVKIYKDPTITSNGAALGVENTYVKDSPKTPQAEIYKNPMISANGGLIYHGLMPANSPSRGINRFFWIDPGHSILLTIQNDITNTLSSGCMYWLEVK